MPGPLSADDAYSADAYYSACRSLRYDLGLIGRYLIAVVGSAFGPAASVGEMTEEAKC